MKLAILLLLFPILSHAEIVSHCTPEVDQEWDQLLLTHTDPEWRHLYKYRKDLCSQGKQGSMPKEEAIERFENERTCQNRKYAETARKEIWEQGGAG